MMVQVESCTAEFLTIFAVIYLKYLNYTFIKSGKTSCYHSKHWLKVKVSCQFRLWKNNFFILEIHFTCIFFLTFYCNFTNWEVMFLFRLCCMETTLIAEDTRSGWALETLRLLGRGASEVPSGLVPRQGKVADCSVLLPWDMVPQELHGSELAL